MADKPDFLDEMQKTARLQFGRELTPAEAAAQLALHPLATRVEHLKNLNTDDRLTVDQAAKRIGYTRAMHSVHRRLRDVNR
jgi:hypothetical protein